MTETTWDYVVQNFSPLLTYFGPGASQDRHGSNLDPAWEQTCPVAPSPQLGSITVCDFSSTQKTNVPGAGVSLSFYGQAIELIGNATEGMQYAVALDGATSAGKPEDRVLASFQNLVLGYHNVSIIADPPRPESAATLLFENAVVTVGTGLTGANVTRTIIQDDDSSLVYTPGIWQTEWFEDWGLQHTPRNTTWHLIHAGASGSVSLNYNAKAIIAHGASWSFFPSTYRVIRDGAEPKVYYGNSSLADASPSHTFLDAVMAFEPNPSRALRQLTIDNGNGEGHLGIDYFEVIAVTGGTPIDRITPSNPPGTSNATSTPTATSRAAATRTVPTAVIVVPIVVLVVLLAFVGIFLYWRRRQRQIEKVDFETVNEPWFIPERMVRREPDASASTL